MRVVEAIVGLPPVLQAFLATLFTWGMTAAGAALVFGTKNVPRGLLDSMLGFAAGVMIAASFWSLLAPAIELSEGGSSGFWQVGSFCVSWTGCSRTCILV